MLVRDIGFGVTIVKVSINVLSTTLVDKWNVLNLSDIITMMTWFDWSLVWFDLRHLVYHFSQMEVYLLHASI